MINASDSVALLALEKVKSDRDAVGPGEYSGRAVVTLDYVLKVGEPYEQRIVGKVPWMALCAVLFGKVNGITLESAIREAIDAKEEAIEDMNARAADAMECLTQPTMRECRGKVTGSANVVGIRHVG